MPAMTAAQIETQIANLVATYTTLSAELSDTQSSPVASSIGFKRLADIRAEIEGWETKLAQVNAGTNRITVSTFGSPA